MRKTADVLAAMGIVFDQITSRSVSIDAMQNCTRRHLYASAAGPSSECVACLTAARCYGVCEFSPWNDVTTLARIESLRRAHALAYATILRRGRPALVFEDDVLSSSSAAAFRADLAAARSSGAELGLFGWCHPLSCCDAAKCTHALWVTPVAARVLLRLSRQCMPSDFPTFWACADGRIRCRRFGPHFAQDRTLTPLIHTARGTGAHREKRQLVLSARSCAAPPRDNDAPYASSRVHVHAGSSAGTTFCEVARRQTSLVPANSSTVGLESHPRCALPCTDASAWRLYAGFERPAASGLFRHCFAYGLRERAAGCDARRRWLLDKGYGVMGASELLFEEHNEAERWSATLAEWRRGLMREQRGGRCAAAASAAAAAAPGCCLCDAPSVFTGAANRALVIRRGAPSLYDRWWPLEGFRPLATLCPTERYTMVVRARIRMAHGTCCMGIRQVHAPRSDARWWCAHGTCMGIRHVHAARHVPGHMACACRAERYAERVREPVG